jgi:hypothetical protein
MKPADRVVQLPPVPPARVASQPAGGYSYLEASQFIEFCVELDNEDDRGSESGAKNPNVWPKIDATKWDPIPVFDSRKAVAKDLLDYQRNPADPRLEGWKKLFDDTLTRARSAPPKSWQFDVVSKDARYNGFGPYQNAWLLYKGVGDFAGAFAVAIRGTVFSAKPSALEDFIFQPLQAREFLSPRVAFAQTGSATMHSGFAHGVFSLLLDDRYGILRQLQDQQVPAGARVYIVGHSQGAALVTLVHAFLHYAAQPGAGEDIFGLRQRQYLLKSYGFAQPKPGNVDFAADFSSYTQAPDNAIVINNNIDPVPQVPLTLQSAGDVASDLPNQSWLIKTLQRVASISNGVVRWAGEITEPRVRKDDSGFGYYFQYPNLALNPNSEVSGGSLNFVPAGHVFYVYGSPGDPQDLFLQHHAWTYRMLLKTQLAY